MRLSPKYSNSSVGSITTTVPSAGATIRLGSSISTTRRGFRKKNMTKISKKADKVILMARNGFWNCM